MWYLWWIVMWESPWLVMEALNRPPANPPAPACLRPLQDEQEFRPGLRAFACAAD